MVETVGLELETHHPVIEPVSAIPGTEISDAETGAQKRPFPPTETRPETSLMYENPHSSALNAIRTDEVRALKTGWWCAQSSANRSPGIFGA